MLAYYTRNRDTPASIAARFAGHNDASLAQRIYRANVNIHANRCMPGPFYAAHRPIQVPLPTTKPLQPMQKARIMSQLQRLTPNDHLNLSRLQQVCHVDPVTIAYAQQLAIRANQRMGTGEHDSWFQLIVDKTEDFVDGLGDFGEHRCEKFLQAVDRIKHQILVYQTATSLENKASLESIRADLKADFDKLHKSYAHEIKYFNIERKSIYKRLSALERWGRAEGMTVLDTKEVRAVATMAKHLKWLGRSFFLVTAVRDVDQIAEAIHHHRPWVKMAVEDAAEIGVQVAAAALVGLVFAAGGWVVVVGAAVTDVALNYFGDKAVNYLGRKI